MNSTATRYETPGWLSEETASRLSVGIDVLLPTDVPAPFGGEPDVDASAGYYSLYWLIPGAPPTYLQITGQVGGTIPDFSYYDRNVQLEVNADVQGYPAYHDLTPIYDKVYWQAGDVVYVVDSHNMAGTDSLTLANSLVVLGPVGGDDQGDDDQTSEPLPTEPPASTETEDDETPSNEPVAASISCPPQASVGGERTISVAGQGRLTVDASDGTFPAAAPNTDFAPDADGSDVLTGTLPAGGSVALSWLAPEVEMSAYIFVRDQEGNTLAECGIQVVTGEVPEEEPTPTRTPKVRAPGVLGDGTWLDENADAVVATVLAYDRARTGDATGGPGDDASRSDEAREAAAVTSTPTVKPKATVKPTATLAPAVGSDGLVAQDIGPEGGQLTCPSGTGATLSIPPNALHETANVRILPVAEAKLPTISNISLVSGTSFDISIADPSGEAVDKLAVPATLTITLPEDVARPGLILYRVVGAGLVPLSDVKVEGTTVSASLNGYSRVVAGMPATSAPASTTRDPMPFILAALTFVVALMIVVAVGSSLLRRRPRTVTPRRTAPSRARIR